MVLVVEVMCIWAHHVKVMDEFINTYSSMGLIVIGIIQLVVPHLFWAWLHPGLTVAHLKGLYHYVQNWKSEWVVLAALPLIFILLGLGLGVVYFLHH